MIATLNAIDAMRSMRHWPWSLWFDPIFGLAPIPFQTKSKYRNHRPERTDSWAFAHNFLFQLIQMRTQWMPIIFSQFVSSFSRRSFHFALNRLIIIVKMGNAWLIDEYSFFFSFFSSLLRMKITRARTAYTVHVHKSSLNSRFRDCAKCQPIDDQVSEGLSSLRVSVRARARWPFFHWHFAAR